MRRVRIKKAPARPGKAIQAKWTTRHELAKLRALMVKAKKQGDLRTWRRGKAVWDYLNGKKVLAIAAEFEVARAAVNQWLRWYDTDGTEALWPRKASGPAPRLTPEQHEELTRLIEEGPQAAGYTGGVWTGPRIGDLDPPAVRRSLPQSPHPEAVASARVLGAAASQAAGTCRQGGAGALAHQAPAGDPQEGRSLPRRRRLRGRSQLLAGRQPASHLGARRGSTSRRHVRAAQDCAHLRRGGARHRQVHVPLLPRVQRGHVLRVPAAVGEPLRRAQGLPDSSTTAPATISTTTASAGCARTVIASSSTVCRPTRPSSCRWKASGKRPAS